MNPSGSVNIYETNVAPQVLHNAAIDLAGGNFAYITENKSLTTGDTETVGHNVKDIEVTDDNFETSGDYPPGNAYTQATGFTNTTFTCSGAYGCHGDRNETDEMVAIKGAHHASDTMLKFGTLSIADQGGSSGKSYRFLDGVRGAEDTDWQNTVGTGDHNEYMGTLTAPTGVSATSPGSGGTISGLCAECHGDFHDAGTYKDGEAEASPWIRHPTNYQLPDDTDKEYKSYNPNGGNLYSTQAPIARPAGFFDGLVSASDIGVPDGSTSNAIVMCLSCHRAHASPYEDILRWKYTDMQAGTSGAAKGTGCFVCHTEKDGA